MNNKLGRWCIQLQEYEFDINHVKGSENEVADTLRRMEVGSLERSQWKKEIEEDKEVNKQKEKYPDEVVDKSRVLYKRTRHGEVLILILRLLDI